jgi:hypothetical protein
MTIHRNSRRAYRLVKPDAKAQEEKLLLAYQTHGPMSDREAFLLLNWEAPSVVSARRSGLIKRGLVAELGEKVGAAGKMVAIWGTISNALAL